MIPSYKSPGIAEFLEKQFGRTSAIKKNRCIDKPIGCGLPALAFRNATAVAEYRISGLCQNCQDAIFDNPTVVDQKYMED